jgi:hypothetical protein
VVDMRDDGDVTDILRVLVAVVHRFLIKKALEPLFG